MAVKLKVPNDLARKAIQEEIVELRKRNVLEFYGKIQKTIAFSKYTFKEMSTICILLPNESLPLSEPFGFSGWAKLTYETIEPQGGVPNYIQDGRNYLVRGKAILTDKDGYIAVSIENNTIEITDQTSL